MELERYQLTSARPVVCKVQIRRLLGLIESFRESRLKSDQNQVLYVQKAKVANLQLEDRDAVGNGREFWSCRGSMDATCESCNRTKIIKLIECDGVAHIVAKRSLFSEIP